MKAVKQVRGTLEESLTLSYKYNIFILRGDIVSLLFQTSPC